MGFRAGDEKLLYAPWTGWVFTTTPAVSCPMRARRRSNRQANFSGTEVESNSPGGRDPYTRFRASMPTEGPLTEAGLEVWPRGIYDLVTKIHRDYNHPIIELPKAVVAIWIPLMKNSMGAS